MSRWKVGLATFAVMACLTTAAQAQVFTNPGINQGFGNAGFGQQPFGNVGFGQQPFGNGFVNPSFGQAFGTGLVNQGFGQPFAGGFVNQGLALPVNRGFAVRSFDQQFLGGNFGPGLQGQGFGQGITPQPQMANGLGAFSNMVRRQVTSKRSAPVRRRR